MANVYKYQIGYEPAYRGTLEAFIAELEAGSYKLSINETGNGCLEFRGVEGDDEFYPSDFYIVEDEKSFFDMVQSCNDEVYGDFDEEDYRPLTRSDEEYEEEMYTYYEELV